MSHQPTFKRPRPPLRKVEAFFLNENHGDEERARIGAGLYFPPNASNTTFRCLSASPFAKSDRDSESSSQQDDEDCGLVMSFTSSSPVCVPCYRYHNFQSNGSPVALRSLPRFLPPIGVFWDIENCQVPKGRSAMAVAQVIRDRFFTGYREAEFLVVCDVKKENSQVIQELNDAQVNLIHVSATCKNAADEKLRQAIRRFADIHGSPASIILISGDINFAADICDLRHRKKIHVILLHKVNTSEALILCASENYNFTHIVESLPPRTQSKFPNQPVEVVISNLPDDKDESRVRNRLKQLSDNCGGRVGSIYKTSASIRFPSMEIANRAKKRMDGEDVFGSKISVSSPTRGLEKKEGSPVKLQSMRKIVGRKEDMAKDLRQVAYSNKSDDSANEVRLAGHNGWQSCPNVQWPADREAEENSLARLRGLPCSNGKPCDGLGLLPSPTMSAIPPPPVLWHAVPSHWVNGNSENSKKYPSIFVPSSKSNSEENEPVSRGAVGKNSDSWLPNKLPDGRRKIRGTHRVSQSEELVEGIDPMRGADPAMFKTSKGNENTLQYYQGHVTTSKKSRTPSPLTTNGSVDSQKLQRHCAQHFPQGLPKTDTNTSKTVSSELSNIKCRTPSPHPVTIGSQEKEMWCHGHVSNWVSGGNSWQSERRSCSPVSSHKTTESDNPEHYFHPIHSVQTGGNGNVGSMLPGSGAFSPVELQVTNLDQDIDAKDMKRILLSVFREHVMVLHVSVFIQSDGNFAASVKVPSLQDAQYAISQLHRRRVGFKRICISYAHSGGPSPQLIRSQIVSLLLEVPGHRLPLFKFRELFESRYLTSVSVSDLHRMKDVIIVTEDSNGRMVLLNPDHRNTPSPVSSIDGPIVDYPYCMMHSKKTKPEKGWAEQEIDVLPNIMVGIKLFGQRIHKLLYSHDGIIPLPSLPDCYQAEFKELEANEEGVPMEHLIMCIQGVEIHQGSSGMKVLRWLKNSNSESVHSGESVKCVSPPLVSQLALFSRELVDLLKTAPHCQLPFNRFIPAYHHHFGRQCRVADYGFTKLIELLEAVPQVVQVMGDGGRRIVTLSHRAQVRRFTSDLLRILKSQANKQVALSAFPSTYDKVIGRPFHAPDYGVCYLQDILFEVSENTVVVSPDPTGSSSDVIISVPKREQTPNEIEKTKQFAVEVVELLRHAPQCSLLFNKFIPAYHHHFGHQCRVADYGFTKLIELFEAIPEVAKIEETTEGERRVTLTVRERLKVLAEQMKSLVQSSGWTLHHHHKAKKSNGQKGTHQQGTPPPLLPLSAIPTAFLRQNGYALHYEDFDCDSLEQLMQCITSTVEVIESPWGPLLSLVDQGVLYQLELQVRCILLNSPNGKRTLEDFMSQFEWKYPGQTCNFEILRKEHSHGFQFKMENEAEVILLTPLEVFGQELLILLGESPANRMTLASLEYAYLERFGVAACPARLGFPSIAAAIHALHRTISLRGRGHKRSIFVNPELTGAGLQLPLQIPVPGSHSNPSECHGDNGSSSKEHIVDSVQQNPDAFAQPMDDFIAEMQNLVTSEEAAQMKKPDSPHKVFNSELSIVAKFAPFSTHPVLWDNHGWGCSQPISPVYPLPPHFYEPTMQSFMQISCDWPQVPTPHVQTSVPAPPPPSTLPPQPLSYSLIAPCPVVPPDPSELPLPLLGPPKNDDRSPQLSSLVVDTLSSAETGTSHSNLSSSPNLSGTGNPARRRMKMKAQFDSPLLLPQ